MTNPGKAMPPGNDWLVRQLKSLQDQINANASAQSLAASSIGSGGLSIIDGGSLEIVGGGTMTVNGTDITAALAALDASTTQLAAVTATLTEQQAALTSAQTALTAAQADLAARVSYSGSSTTSLILSTTTSTTGIVPLTLAFTTTSVRNVLVRFTCDAAGIGNNVGNAETQAILTLTLKNSVGSVIASTSGFFSFNPIAATAAGWSLTSMMQAEELMPGLPAGTYTLGATVQLTSIAGSTSTASFGGGPWSAFAQVIS